MMVLSVNDTRHLMEEQRWYTFDSRLPRLTSIPQFSLAVWGQSNGIYSFCAYSSVSRKGKRGRHTHKRKGGGSFNEEETFKERSELSKSQDEEDAWCMPFFICLFESAASLLRLMFEKKRQRHVWTLSFEMSRRYFLWEEVSGASWERDLPEILIEIHRVNCAVDKLRIKGISFCISFPHRVFLSDIRSYLVGPSSLISLLVVLFRHVFFTSNQGASSRIHSRNRMRYISLPHPTMIDMEANEERRRTSQETNASLAFVDEDDEIDGRKSFICSLFYSDLVLLLLVVSIFRILLLRVLCEGNWGSCSLSVHWFESLSRRRLFHLLIVVVLSCNWIFVELDKWRESGVSGITFV